MAELDIEYFELRDRDGDAVGLAVCCPDRSGTLYRMRLPGTKPTAGLSWHPIDPAQVVQIGNDWTGSERGPHPYAGEDVLQSLKNKVGGLHT